MKIIIAGGGTGGHVFPAISIAQEISERDQGDEVLFIGTKAGMENELVLKNGYEIQHISSRGFVGRGFFKTVLAAFSAFKGLLDSISIIQKYKPNIVLGVGGYVSGPFLIAASLLRVPTAICEQNTIPGVTNRILGKIVNVIFASYDSNVQYFPSKKVLITGNPIRRDIISASNNSRGSDDISVLVFGGSQGAYSLNRFLPEAFSKIEQANISIVHQTGKKDYEFVKQLYSDNRVEAKVLQFIDDMAGAYSDSDLVIGRAGAGTIAEVTALGKPSILVPFPYAAHDHQLENAKVMQDYEAAVLIEDKDATPEKLAFTLTDLLNRDKLNDMSNNARKLGRPEAAKEIVNELYRLAGDK